MKIQDFSRKCGLVDKTENEKAYYLAFYNFKQNDKLEFNIKEVGLWFHELHFAVPNLARLRKKLIDSRKVISAGNDQLKLHALTLRDLELLDLLEVPRSEEAKSSSYIILDPSLYSKTRGYLEKLAEQINVCYENNAFDGAAVLMRRFMEVLLILSYEHLAISKSIKDTTTGDYFLLELIIKDAKINRTLNLSRNSKSFLDTFRKLGNFSAHKVTFNTLRSDIYPNILDFRSLVEELMYKAGLRK